MSASSTTALLSRALTTTTRRRSGWNRVGRWGLLGGIIGLVIIIALLVCCCLVLRRAKKSKAQKHARDTEAGAYTMDKVHQPSYSAPTQPPPARMAPSSNGPILAHDYVTSGNRPHAQYDTPKQERADFAQTGQMYTGGGQTGHVGHGNTNHIGNGNTGYANNGNTGYATNEHNGYAQHGNTGYTTNENTGYATNENTGYAGQRNDGYVDSYQPRQQQQRY